MHLEGYGLGDRLSVREDRHEVLLPIGEVATTSNNAHPDRVQSTVALHREAERSNGRSRYIEGCLLGRAHRSAGRVKEL